MRSTRPRLVTLVLSGCVLCSNGVVHAAEPLRLRPLAPVYAGTRAIGLAQPEGVSCSGENELIVADTGNGRLVVYSIEPKSVTPGREIALTQVPRPTRVRTRSDGEILVVDGKLRRIARVSPAGEFLGYLEPAGVSGAVVPRSLEIDGNDRLYVLDVFSERVLVLDEKDEIVREIGFPEAYGFFSDVAVAPRGTLYAIDSVGRRIYSAGQDDEVLSPLPGTLEEAAEFPTSLKLDGSGRFLVGDQNGGSIIVAKLDGSFLGRQLSEGWKVGLLRYPSALCIDEAGLLHVADRANNRIQSFAIVR